MIFIISEIPETKMINLFAVCKNDFFIKSFGKAPDKTERWKSSRLYWKLVKGWISLLQSIKEGDAELLQPEMDLKYLR